ncbi:MAG TPA: bifunctional riboflavin kinase/FAD synthetase [Syntrophales bacterium]|nr:bifunctional riboflavin kinase/FAD synthetase [Syntrophales bacterium]
MHVFTGTEGIPSEFRKAFITIGNFDGVHLGHRFIFQKLILEAHKENRKALLVTFVPHPKMLLHPERRPFYLLTTIEEKIKLLEALGLDALILIPFTLEYAQTTAESFILDVLWKNFQVRKIFIGHDYRFGKDKRGDEDMLTAFGKKLGFDVAVINAVAVGDTVISSTRIRAAILEGDVKTAAMLLGRPYNVSGTVIEGKRRGAALGFPTANIKPNKELLPAKGVYAAIVNLEGKRYNGALSIGLNPTFGDVQLSMEVHLMDFNGDIYGKYADVLFIERIRGERKFPGPEMLSLQIKKDVEEARDILKSSVANFPLSD